MKTFIPPQNIVNATNSVKTRSGGNNLKSMAQSKLENIVSKSMQVIQSTSYRQQPTSGGEAIAFPSPTYDTMYSMVLSNSTARPMIMKKRDIAFKTVLQTDASVHRVKLCCLNQTE